MKIDNTKYEVFLNLINRLKSVGKTWDEIKTLSTNPSDTQSKLDSIVDLNVSERIDLKEWEELVDEVHEMENLLVLLL